MKKVYLSIVVCVLVLFNTKTIGQSLPYVIQNIGTTPLPIRSGPGSDYSSMTYIQSGVKVVAIAEIDKWYLVNIPTEGNNGNARSGWVEHISNELEIRTDIPQIEIIKNDIVLKKVAGGNMLGDQLVWTEDGKWGTVFAGQRFPMLGSQVVDNTLWYLIELPDGYYDNSLERQLSTAWVSNEDGTMHKDKPSKGIASSGTTTDNSRMVARGADEVGNSEYDDLPPALPSIILPFNITFDLVEAGYSTQKSFTIYNEGNAPLKFLNLEYPDGFDGPDIIEEVLPGAFTTINITFNPRSDVSYNGTLEMHTNDPSSPHNILLSGATPRNIFFEGTLSDLRKKAQKESKSYIMYFTAPKCGPCKRMKLETFTNAELAGLIDTKILFFEADVQMIDALAEAQEYGVSVYPTLIFFSLRAKLLENYLGISLQESSLRLF